MLFERHHHRKYQQQPNEKMKRNGHSTVIRWLLNDAKMSTMDCNKMNALALHYASAKGCLECVKLLIQSSDQKDLR